MTDEIRRSPVEDAQRLDRIRSLNEFPGIGSNGSVAFLLDYIDDLTADRDALRGACAYRRDVLIETLIYHWPTRTSGCGCGWAVLGASHPAHVANVYEASVAAWAEPEKTDGSVEGGSSDG